MSPSRRQCRCGTHLSRDTTGDLCGPCARRLTTADPVPPEVPADFWDTPTMRAALATHHMGKVITAYRTHPFHGSPVSQTTVATWARCAQPHVSRIENGSAIDSIAKLEFWSLLLGIPKRLQWFSSAGERVSREPAPTAPKPEAIHLVQLEAIPSDPINWFEGLRLKIEERSEVGHDHVDIVNEMVQTFRRLDNRFGGGRARSMVNNFLSTEVIPILHIGTFRGSVRERFFSATADLSHLAGWMAYDVGDTKSGLRYLQQALRFSNEVGDYARVAEMFAGMSHQASFMRSPDVAIDFADGAHTNAKKSGIVILEVESFVMSAHGFAIKGDSIKSREAMRGAEQSFKRADLSAIPEWLRYFDEAYMSAKFAHCFRELGNFKEAEVFARRSLDMSEGYDRGRLFNTALLASILADQGAIDEACVLSLDALTMAEKMQSDRTNKYLSEVAQKLSMHGGAGNVSSVLERYASAGLIAG